MLLELVYEARQHASGHELANDLTVRVEAVGAALENVLQLILLGFHVESEDLRDVRHLAAAVLQARYLHDELYARADLRAHGGERHLDVAHHGHGFQAGERVARVAGVERAHATTVTAGHGLHDIQCFTAADF